MVWRVQLEKTPLGYVGKSFPIARLSMLTLDVAISPRGEMYVACHSGLPDWGTGPQGEGRLFRIVRTNATAAQPVLAWPSAPSEVRMHFDRKLPEAAVASLISPGATPAGITIEFGNYVSAGDEGATLKPPYAVVEQQDATPRGRLAVHSARLEDDGTTLVLTTDPHSMAVRHVLKLPMRIADSAASPGDRMEIEYDFHGVAVTYRPHRRQPERTPWKGFLPYPNWRVGERFLRPWLARLEARTKPSPGGDIGTLAYEMFAAARLRPGWFPPLADEFWHSMTTADALESGRMMIRIEETLAYDGASEYFLGFSSTDSHRLVAPPLDSFWLPWAPTNRASSGTDSRVAAKPDGDWEHGRELFASPQWNCVKCHRVRGEGGVAGPDLSNLVHRDPTSVLRDIRDPGATLHPDYVAYRAEMRDGEMHVGFLRGSADGNVRIFDVDGRETVLARKDVANLHPTGQSLMPSGLLDGRSEGDIKDLLTFLLHEPPVRTRSAVEALIPPAAAAEPDGRPIRLVLVASKQDHGPGQHDYPAWQERWMRLLASAATNTVVEKAWEWPSTGQWAGADGVVFYFWNHEWTPERYAQLDSFQERGGGLVFLHSAVIADRDPEPLAERIGLSAQPGRTGYRHMPFDLVWAAPQHPLLTGLPGQIPFLDEPYWPLVGDPARVTVLGQARVDGAERPLVWTFERGRGRVFASI
ncbi:MAG: ThuA domain-containing protein, partial [Verrucomicrobia bacterium]|nr:ThuA domain-containing protein [Verrucomicrobiota bacterium]